MAVHIAAPGPNAQGLEIGAKIADNHSQKPEKLKRLASVAEARGEVTELLAELKLGRKDALDRLMPLVYRELRRIAGHQMRDERVGHTLQPTALVHEAFLRLVEQSRADWQNRAQFVGVSAQPMRRLLVDHARRRNAAKRGIPITLNEEIFRRGTGGDQTEEILAVDEVLARLTKLDPRQARVDIAFAPPKEREVRSWEEPRRRRHEGDWVNPVTLAPRHFCEWGEKFPGAGSLSV
jgi:RNA polymerase sigma factor (TIGR02999 family)